MHETDVPFEASLADSSVLSTFLSRADFADALGMDENDVFIQRMFSAVAKRHPDKICFQEFLEMVVLFSKGKCMEQQRT